MAKPVKLPEGFILDQSPTSSSPSNLPEGFVLDQPGSQPQPSPEQMGALKAGALGLMSGVPGAETAISGVKSAIGPNTYDVEHQQLEALKDKAWEEQPLAYGTGKVAGFAGTGLVAPEGLAGMALTGAGYGADVAQNLGDIPKSALLGAGTGAAVGTVANKVLEPLITKVAPMAAKGALSSLGPSSEAIETRLANPETLSSAMGPQSQADVLESLSNSLRKVIGQDSKSALSKLSPSSYTDHTEIAPLFDQIKQGLATDGVLVGPAQQNAVDSLGAFQKSLETIAAKNNGYIPDTSLAQIVRDIDDNTNWTDQTQKVTNGALKQLRHGLDTMLKENNPEYEDAMKPVAQNAALLDKLRRTFGLKFEPGAGLTATDATASKISNVLGENKSNAQDVLKQLTDLTGYDFLENAKNYNLGQEFEGGGGAVTSIIGHALGYGTGRMTGLPGGGLMGSLVGGQVGRSIDGGALAGRIIDGYLNIKGSMADTGVTKALQTYGPILINAAKQGGNNLAATHFVLATSHPEYQKVMDHFQNNVSNPQ